MARYLCTKQCFWKSRAWVPDSRLEKDRVYVGEDTPPANCFKELGATEELPSLGEEGNTPIALSQLQKKSVQIDAAVIDSGNMPVIPEGDALI